MITGRSEDVTFKLREIRGRLEARALKSGMGFRLRGSGCRVSGLGLGFRMQVSGFGLFGGHRETRVTG